ncbi:MAG: hypothetical protein HZB75_02230 [Candidatus Saccharibacteria bacterium]|nr:MAG: hypothetical protein HZB75_02230 [Candidatus Saccharibacteria bacterium]
MDWAQILVILLSIFLAIFLLLAIVLTALLIKVTRQIKSVTNSAQRTAEHMESAVAGLGKTISPMFVMGIIKKFMKKDKK